jgi:hypothetical protein
MRIRHIVPLYFKVDGTEYGCGLDFNETVVGISVWEVVWHDLQRSITARQRKAEDLYIGSRP